MDILPSILFHFRLCFSRVNLGMISRTEINTRVSPSRSKYLLQHNRINFFFQILDDSRLSEIDQTEYLIIKNVRRALCNKFVENINISSKKKGKKRLIFDLVKGD